MSKKETIFPGQKEYDELFEKLEKKVMPILGYFSNKFEGGIIDIDFESKYLIRSDDSFISDRLRSGFIRIITENDIDDSIKIFYIDKNIDYSQEEECEKKNLEYLCSQFMVDNLSNLMYLSEILLKTLDYYIEQEEEYKIIIKKINNIPTLYINKLLIEKVKNNYERA